MNIQEVQRLATESLTEVAAADQPQPGLLEFLLQCYSADVDAESREVGDESREVIEAALGRAIAARSRALEAGSGAPSDAVEWLSVFVRVAELSTDPRVAAIVADLVAHVRLAWMNDAVAGQARAVSSCLGAVACLNTLAARETGAASDSDDVAAFATAARELLQACLDRLETLVHRAYQPGAGMRTSLDEDDLTAESDLFAQMATADALLCAYAATRRVPYAMLAEEIVLVARRRWWQDTEGGFGAGGGTMTGPDVAANSLAVRILCRLARLASDAEWRASSDSDVSYRYDAERTLLRLGPMAERAGSALRADYALALVEWLEGS